MGTPELICDVINEDNSDGNTEGLIVAMTETVKLVLFDSKMLYLADFYKFGEENGCKECA